MADRSALERFFHDLATPLSGLSLHLERALRLSEKGEDATEALGVAPGWSGRSRSSSGDAMPCSHGRARNKD